MTLQTAQQQQYESDFLMATRKSHKCTAALLHEAPLQQQCDEEALCASAWHLHDHTSHFHLYVNAERVDKLHSCSSSSNTYL